MQLGWADRDRRIDDLRGLSISVVLVHHFYLAYGLPHGPAGSTSDRCARSGAQRQLRRYRLLRHFRLPDHVHVAAPLWQSASHLAANLLHLSVCAHLPLSRPDACDCYNAGSGRRSVFSELTTRLVLAGGCFGPDVLA